MLVIYNPSRIVLHPLSQHYYKSEISVIQVPNSMIVPHGFCGGELVPPPGAPHPNLREPRDLRCNTGLDASNCQVARRIFRHDQS